MMFNIKSILFQYFTERQRSGLFSFLKSFVKKHQNLNKAEIIDKFIEEENYYFEINNPHFEFLIPYLSNEDFLRDLDKFVDFVFLELKQKEALKPIIEKQKQIMREKKKRIFDFKMSKLKPTKKQLYYYEKISKAHGIEMKPTENATRLDLRNWIMEILEPPVERDEDE